MTAVGLARSFVLIATLAFMWSGFGEAQEEPSFDCKGARTHVEHILCSGGNSGFGWLDQTMDAQFKAAQKAAGASANTVRTSQRAWLAQRDKCSGTDDQVSACLQGSYKARFAQLASPYDTVHLTGGFWNERERAGLDSVLFPDHSIAITISASTGAPSYNSCKLTFQAPVQSGQATYTPTADENIGGGQCTFRLTLSGLKITVNRDGCVDFCGNGASIGGDYDRIHPNK